MIEPFGPRPTHNALLGQAAAAQNSPYLMPRRACRSLAPLRGGAAASSASLSPDFLLKTFAPLMVSRNPRNALAGSLASGLLLLLLLLLLRPGQPVQNKFASGCIPD
jgi:hypothetical protein